MQEAVAAGLEEVKQRDFVEKQRAEYLERRDILAHGFDKLGMRYTLPEGTYFLLLVRLYMSFFLSCSETAPPGYLELAMARGFPLPRKRAGSWQGLQVSHAMVDELPS